MRTRTHPSPASSGFLAALGSCQHSRGYTTPVAGSVRVPGEGPGWPGLLLLMRLADSEARAERLGMLGYALPAVMLAKTRGGCWPRPPLPSSMLPFAADGLSSRWKASAGAPGWGCICCQPSCHK